ncbi:hypothetical protein AAFF_G00198960 [Aldrovandia affinis]|uniref:Uncharacterized protein n=1 Tax=Aldrovandia affinis TaxID=143900 RepID=A0AAD7W5Z7_9TELE|nr:hypothetical protein AAFF_G00198960 [Aldrovandia affinis]
MIASCPFEQRDQVEGQVIPVRLNNGTRWRARYGDEGRGCTECAVESQTSAPSPVRTTGSAQTAKRAWPDHGGGSRTSVLTSQDYRITADVKLTLPRVVHPLCAAQHWPLVAGLGYGTLTLVAMGNTEQRGMDAVTWLAEEEEKRPGSPYLGENSRDPVRGGCQASLRGKRRREQLTRSPLRWPRLCRRSGEISAGGRTLFLRSGRLERVNKSASRCGKGRSGGAGRKLARGQSETSLSHLSLTSGERESGGPIAVGNGGGAA